VSRVVVVAYDPTWPRIFEELRAPVAHALGDLAVAIEHVGSTSVPGLVAKPIVDMTVVVASRDDVPAAIERLATLGYRHRGDLGIVDREAFHAPADRSPHHLYVCPRDSVALQNHLAVRDALRARPALSTAYGALKQRLAAEFPDDIDGYVDGKTSFLLAILADAGLSADRRDAIEAANRRR